MRARRAVPAPHCAPVCRDAVEDQEMERRGLHAAPCKLRHVAVADPGAELARIAGLCAKGADAQTGDLDAMLVGIEPARGLPEHLAQSVMAVGSRRLVR